MMINMLYVKRENQWIIFSLLALLSLMMASFMFLALHNIEGYNPELHKKGYMGFFILQFFMSSFFVPFFKNEEKGFKFLTKSLFDVAILSLSIVPLMLIIFFVGGVNGMNPFIPICIQILWGGTILSLKKLLDCCSLDKIYQNLILAIFIFSMTILSCVLLYAFVIYSQSVITTVFDKDIPLIFFTNPALTIIGILHVQAGGTTQMGFTPVIFCGLFWGGLSILMSLISHRLSEKRRIGHGK